MSKESTQVQLHHTKFCVHCGAEIDVNAEICPKCGVRQPLMVEEVSNAWYLAPFFLGIIGGLVAWFAIKDRNPKKARNFLIFGVVWTILSIVISITIAIAVSYWMGGISNQGISSQYLKFEKVEITSAYCSHNTGATYWTSATDTEYWEITLDLRNTGTTEASIIGAFVNNKAIADYGTSGTNKADTMLAWEDPGAGEVSVDFDAGGKLNVDPGSSTKIIIRIKEVPDTSVDYIFTSGTTIGVSIVSSSDNECGKMVTLT